MSEKDIKKLVQESKTSPSDSFTDSVMRDVELLTMPKNTFPWKGILTILFATAFIVLLFIYVSRYSFNVEMYGVSVSISPVLIQLIGMGVFLFGMLQVLLLYESTKEITTA